MGLGDRHRVQVRLVGVRGEVGRIENGMNTEHIWRLPPPRTGAVAISIMGGIGMMSAGLVGSPGLGYAKDRFAGEELDKANPGLYAEYKAAQPSQWLVFKPVHGIDGTKLGAAQTATTKTPEQQTVLKANMDGDRHTLKADSFIPMVMAAIYLGMIFYFKTKGGYKPVHIVPIAETEKRAEAPAV